MSDTTTTSTRADAPNGHVGSAPQRTTDIIPKASFRPRRGRLVPKAPRGPFNVVGGDAVSCDLQLSVTT